MPDTCFYGWNKVALGGAYVNTSLSQLLILMLIRKEKCCRHITWRFRFRKKLHYVFKLKIKSI